MLFSKNASIVNESLIKVNESFTVESKEIITEVKKHWSLSTDTSLAEKLGVSKQVINGFKNKKTIDIQAKIIKLLLEELE